MTNSLPVPARSVRAVFAQLSSRAGSSENGAVAANAVRTNAARRAGVHAVADDVADDQDGGVLRPLGHEVEVAADVLGGGQERRGELQAGALGQLGRGERVADRAQVLELVLGRLEALAQGREVLVAHRGLSPKTRDQRLLAVLVLVPIAGLALSRVDLRGQPPWLVFFSSRS